jgi:TorA maturation chaperone TorD
LVYREAGLIVGLPTDLVLLEYCRFEIKGQFKESPDHIALELDLVHFLCEQEAKAWQGVKGGRGFLDDELRFQEEHLVGWVPTLCENVRKFDTTGFYSALSGVTKGWIFSGLRDH